MMQKGGREIGPRRWAHEELYSRPETMISFESLPCLGSHSLSSVYRTSQVRWSCPRCRAERRETQQCVTGTFTREKISGGLHPSPLFIPKCKATWGCHEHLREELPQPPWKPVQALNHPWEGSRDFWLMYITKFMVNNGFSSYDFIKSQNMMIMAESRSWYNKILEITNI